MNELKENTKVFILAIIAICLGFGFMHLIMKYIIL